MHYLWILSYSVITICISEVYSFGFGRFYPHIHPYNSKRQVHVLFATSGDGVYVGETKNYRPHGFGNKTWNNGNNYIGFFDNGQRTGYGILTTADGIYRYDGNWFNDVPYGNGTLLAPEGTFTGQFKSDTFDGFGQFNMSTGAFYIGYWKNGAMEGFGTLVANSSFVNENNVTGFGTWAANGFSYEGEFKNGTLHGNGTLQSDGVYFKGNFKNGAMDGLGTLIANASLMNDIVETGFETSNWTAKGFTYEGQFKNDTMHGNGTFQSDGILYIGNHENGFARGYGFLDISFPDGTSYVGETLDANPHGNGTLVYLTSDGQFEKYSGHISNGVRNGFGELQYADGRVYNGHWLDDFEHGLGEVKFSNQTYNLSYTGEFANGYPNGLGTTVDGGTIFIGNHANGLPNGLGNANYSDGRFYKGQFKYGVLNGKGTLIFNSDQYNGEFLNDVKSGYGEMKYSNGMHYSGQWLKDKKHGNGTEVTDLGIYKGEFKFGNKDGYGQFNYSNGNVYIGEWKNGLKFGIGTYVTSVGTYIGEFKYDNFDGLGKFKFEDGSVYEGEFKDNSANGNGTSVSSKALLNVTSYTGEWMNWERNGYGKLTVNNEYGYEGEWRNDMRHGCGRVFYKNGSSEQFLWRNDTIRNTDCFQKVNLLQMPDGRIFVGEFGDKNLNGTGLFFAPGQYFQHGLFEEGEFLHGLEYYLNGIIIFSSYNLSKPFGYGYLTKTTDFKIKCVNWDSDEENLEVPCGSDMQLKRYENYETYYGQLRKDKRHGYGEFKERKDCSESVCHIGRWRSDKPYGFGIRKEPFQNTLIGQFKNGLLEGSGISLSPSKDHNTVYFGGWKNGKREGVGVFIYPDGEMVIGFYIEGKISRVFDTPTPIFIDAVGNQQEF